MDDKIIENMLETYYQKDMHYEDGRILGSMYTRPPDIVIKAFFKFYQANLGNPGLYPGTKEMEKHVVNFLLKLASGKDYFYGHVLSGGTEANITALWAARNMGFSKVLTTKDVHFSIIKAVDLLGLELEYVPMKNFSMDPKALEEIIQDGSIVVANAGTTPLGYIDPIEDIGKLCNKINCYLHVDAAFGGFVIPFLSKDEFKFGFDVSAVKSITIDPHKMGMAPYPAGGLIARDNIFERITVDAPYLIQGKSDTLLGTRQSGSVAASYAAILHFGVEGYKKIVDECMKNTEYLVSMAEEMNFEVLTKPVMNIVNLVVDNPKKVQKELFKRGWAISINPEYNSIRIVVMPHVKKEIIEKFLKEMEKIRDHF